MRMTDCDCTVLTAFRMRIVLTVFCEYVLSRIRHCVRVCAGRWSVESTAHAACTTHAFRSVQFTQQNFNGNVLVNSRVETTVIYELIYG